MIPVLNKVILNGASRHRLDKGFIVIGDGRRPVDASARDQIVRAVNQALTAQPELSGFAVEARPAHVSLIGLATSFLPVYDVAHRDAFIARLATATGILIQTASRVGCSLTAAGVNPFAVDTDSQVPALCADLHQIEVFDDGEIERVYNLYRQFLPELLAISTHAAVYGGALQKDFSLRMRVNPAAFLPRYLSQFSAQHLDKLKSMMRKDYGLADLRQMDVSPLAGDPSKLTQNNPSLLSQIPAAVELRFVDAQCAHPFIRAQLILFQAIAMYGRALARRGRRLPYMRDEVIDENKALAVQSGPGAILKPDEKFKKDDGKQGYSFHDQGTPERATTALLMVLDGLLLPYLRELGCQYWELAPIVLGAELRRQGRQCFANYAEYQKYLYYVYSGRFASAFQQQVEQLLTSPNLDHVTDYNQRTYSDLAVEIEHEWTEKLKLHIGYVARYNEAKGFGFIAIPGEGDVFVHRSDVLGGTKLSVGDVVSFGVVQHSRGPGAVCVQVQRLPRQQGQVKWFNAKKRFGFITQSDGSDIFVSQNSLEGVSALKLGQRVSFEIGQSAKGPMAIHVRVVKEG